MIWNYYHGKKLISILNNKLFFIDSPPKQTPPSYPLLSSTPPLPLRLSSPPQPLSLRRSDPPSPEETCWNLSAAAAVAVFKAGGREEDANLVASSIMTVGATVVKEYVNDTNEHGMVKTIATKAADRMLKQ